MSKINYRVVLKERPGVNRMPEDDNFRYETCAYPSEDLDTNEVLIKTCYLSIDPASRCQMNEDTGVLYLQPWKIGETIVGLSGVGVVVKSAHPDYNAGDVMYSFLKWPWILYFTRKITDGTGFRKIDLATFGGKMSMVLHLGVGLTAMIGIQQKGHVTPGANQTCVVSGAAGACGSIAGQVALLEGCKNLVGICGSQEKCDWLVTALPFNGAINYKKDNVDQKLAELCPAGIDVYFDNVGGDISDSVIKQMNKNSHVVLCGQISQYNKDVPYPPPLADSIQQKVNENNITRERFLVLNYTSEFDHATWQLLQWIHRGEVKIRETVTEGLGNAGRALVSLMRGGNMGKQLVHVSDP